MEEIHFSTTDEDYRYFMFFAFFSRPLSVITFLIVVVAASLILSFVLSNPMPLLLIALIPLQAFKVWRNASKTAQEARKRGANIITIGPENIRQRNGEADSTVSWRMIKAIRQDKHNFYIQIDNPNSKIFQAFLIPRRVFASSKEAESFIERARGYWREQSGQIAAAQ